MVVTDNWLQRLLVWTPGQTDLIKTVALLLMVADHTSLLFGLDNDALRLLGRGAFPLFGLVWAMNLARHPRIRQSSLNRLWVWAVAAQGGWILAGLQPYEGNILFAFAVSGQTLALMQQHGPRVWPLSLVLAWLPFSDGSYGLAGVMMLLLACGVCMTGRRTTRTGLACCLALYLPLSNTSYGLTGMVMLSLAIALWQVPSRRRGGLRCVWLTSVLLLNWHNGGVMMASGLLLSLVVLYSVSVLVPGSSLRLGSIGRGFTLGYVGHLVLISVAVLL